MSGQRIPLEPLDEERRLAVLRSFEVLDTPPERALDDITRLASRLCGTPIALVSLVDESRQWFKARVGIDATETPRAWAFCDHAIRDRGVFVVEDAREDARFADNPLVTGDPLIRFYAGAPLEVEDTAIGTLCVIDREPRALTGDRRAELEGLARLVVDQLELRRSGVALSAALRELETLEGLLPVCADCRKVRDDDTAADRWLTLDAFLDEREAVEITRETCPACAAAAASPEGGPRS